MPPAQFSSIWQTHLARPLRCEQFRNSHLLEHVGASLAVRLGCYLEEMRTTLPPVQSRGGDAVLCSKISSRAWVAGELLEQLRPLLRIKAGTRAIVQFHPPVLAETISASRCASADAYGPRVGFQALLFGESKHVGLEPAEQHGVDPRFP